MNNWSKQAAEEAADQLQTELAEQAKSNMAMMADQWGLMGLNKPMLDDRKATVIQMIQVQFDKMVAEERSHVDQLIKCVEGLGLQTMKIQKELNRTTASKSSWKEDSFLDINEDIPLIQTKKMLEEKLAQLMSEREERMVAIRELTTGDADASRWVGREPLALPKDIILIPDEMEELRQHIDQMTELRRQRTGQLGEMQLEIDTLCKTLEEEPRLEVERRMLMENPAEVVLSDDNMAAVNGFLERLQTKVEENQHKKTAMVEKIQSLCHRLGYDHDETRPFLPEDEAIHDRALTLVQAKVGQLEALKRKHMTDFIAASKRELESVWKRCYFSDRHMAEFLPYHTDNIDESTLDALETELDRLKKYHEHNKAIYDKVDEWHQTWLHKLEVEERSKDKTRLMGRGRNNLLEEEKERKAVQRRLPKVEKELVTLVDAYADANQREFQIQGMNVKDYVCDQKMEHNFEVKEEQEIKKVIKKKQIDNETRYGQPTTPVNQTSAALMKSRRGGELTRSGHTGGGVMNSGVKRTLGSQSDLNVTKRRRVNVDASIVGGNLHGAAQGPSDSISSAASSAFTPTRFKNQDIVSSTFYNETQTLPRTTRPKAGLTGMTGTLRTPSKPGGLSSTPSRSTTSLFKTPQSTAPSTASRSRVMRRSKSTVERSTVEPLSRTKTPLRSASKASGSTASLSSKSNTLGRNKPKPVPFKL